MRVGLVFNDLNPEVGGGHVFEQQILDSILSFAELSHHHFVIISFGLKSLTYKVSVQKNIEFISIDYKQFKNLGLIGHGIADAVIRRIRRPDVSFSSTLFEESRSTVIYQLIKKYRLAWLWSVSPKVATMEIPYTLTVWDLQHRVQPYFPEVSGDANWDIRESFYAKSIKRASFVITGTTAGKAEIQNFYCVPAERIKILPLPTPQFATVGMASTPVDIFTKYNLPKNYLFYPAQFWAHKNHANLLLAIELLRDKYQLNFTIAFTGSNHGGNLSYIKQLTNELKLTEQVKFLGFVPQEDLPQLYSSALALTFVSFFGPDNLPPLEAFALGCPVIAANVPGAEEQLGEAALLVSPQNVEQIALAIRSMYSDPGLRQKMIQLGFAKATQWTGEDYVKGMFNILNEAETIRRCWHGRD